MERLRNYNFIIPRPKPIIKREMPENQGKTPSSPPTSCPKPAGQRRKDDVASPALNIKSLLSSKSFSPRKNVRPGFQEKSGRHIGLKRPYVLGCFEVKQVNRGCLATFCGTGKRRFFLFRYAQAFYGAKRWTSALRNRENRRDIPDFRRGNCAPRVICARRKGRRKRRATSAR